VEDAAGNRRVALGPLTDWRVENHPARLSSPGLVARPPAPPVPVPNGIPATERSRLDLFFAVPRTRRICGLVLNRRSRPGRRCRRVRTGESVRRGAVLATPYGRRVRLRGRLMTLDGRPIRWAQLHLRRLRRGARRPLERFDVRTDRAGRFHTVLGRSPSERIRAVYYPTSATRRPVISRALVRRVPAGIWLRASRHGARLALHGRLLGGSRPAGGVRVRAELRLGGRWAGLAERRVRGGPSFVIGRTVGRRGPLRVRLRVLRSPGYPYEPSVSRVAKIAARG
jgi:hypothetical protein